MGLKIPPFDLRQMFNTDEGFYDLIGPFLSRREVVNELGSPVWDDDGKEWLVAVARDDGEVFGFAAVNGQTIQSFYVVPDARRETIGAAILSRLIATNADRTLKATATPASVHLFELYGFEELGQRGRFTLMERTS